MARRFAPIPHDAFDALEEGDAYAILDLYMRGHNMRWKPRKVTERALSKLWGVSTRRVWVILDTLEGLDLLTFEKGTNRKPSTVTVHDPTRAASDAEEGDVEGEQGGEEDARRTGRQEGRRTGRRTGRQNSEGSNEESADPVAQVVALLAALPVAQVEALLLSMRPEPRPEQRPETEDKEPAAPTPAQPSLLGTDPVPTAKPSFGPAEKRKAAQRIFEAYRVHHPRKTLLDTDLQKIIGRLTEIAKARKDNEKRARYTAEDWSTAEQDLLDLVDWFHIAPGAKWWQGDNPDRQKHLGIGMVFRKSTLSDRLDNMAAWRSRGKPHVVMQPRHNGGGGDILDELYAEYKAEEQANGR